MSLPSSPNHNDTGTLNGSEYQFDSDLQAWIIIRSEEQKNLDSEVLRLEQEIVSSIGGFRAGTIMAFAMSDIPIGFRIADGSQYNTSAYPVLFERLGTDRLPDLRNQFLRGWNNDSDGFGNLRTVLSAQDEEVGPHTHPTNALDTGGGISYSAGPFYMGGATIFENDGVETRPINTSVVYAIAMYDGAAVVYDSEFVYSILQQHIGRVDSEIARIDSENKQNLDSEIHERKAEDSDIRVTIADNDSEIRRLLDSEITERKVRDSELSARITWLEENKVDSEWVIAIANEAGKVDSDWVIRVANEAGKVDSEWLLTAVDEKIEKLVDSDFVLNLIADSEWIDAKVYAEAVVRANADSDLNNAIVLETTNRIDADSELDDRITSNDIDIHNLYAADSDLSVNLDSDFHALESVDSDLQIQINALDADLDSDIIFVRSLFNMGAQSAGFPVGSVVPFAVSNLPQGFLLADGSVFNTTLYPELETYLGGNVLPDYTGRSLYYKTTDYSFNQDYGTDSDSEGPTVLIVQPDYDEVVFGIAGYNGAGITTDSDVINAVVEQQTSDLQNEINTLKADRDSDTLVIQSLREDLDQAVSDRVFTDNQLSARLDGHDSDLQTKGRFYVQSTPPSGGPKTAKHLRWFLAKLLFTMHHNLCGNT